MGTASPQLQYVPFYCQNMRQCVSESQCSFDLYRDLTIEKIYDKSKSKNKKQIFFLTQYYKRVWK